MKFWAKIILIGFVVSMLFAVTSTFAHAERRCVDDKGNPHSCNYIYDNYVGGYEGHPFVSHNSQRAHRWQEEYQVDSYYHQEPRRRKHHHSRYDETYYYDEWEYEQPRRRKLKFKPRIFFDIYLD